MAAELDLFGPTPSRIEAAFAAFHEANPHVYRTLEALAMRWTTRRPGRHFGIAMLYETARYHIGLETVGDDFTLNNNWRALYARMLLDRHPEWGGLLETRERREPGATIA